MATYGHARQRFASLPEQARSDGIVVLRAAFKAFAVVEVVLCAALLAVVGAVGRAGLAGRVLVHNLAKVELALLRSDGALALDRTVHGVSTADQAPPLLLGVWDASDGGAGLPVALVQA